MQSIVRDFLSYPHPPRGFLFCKIRKYSTYPQFIHSYQKIDLGGYNARRRVKRRPKQSEPTPRIEVGRLYL